MRLISKSRYLQGLQCSKLFWTQYNDKEKIPPPDAATQAIFDQGHDVGDLAKSLYPGGMEIEGDPWKFADLMARTREAMKKRVPLYEAAFGGRNAFARADILVPVEDGAWDIVEVKSGTQVKPVNIHDLALQRFAAESGGLKIGRCVLMHVDNTYVRHGAIETEKLFAREDVTSEVAEDFKNVESKLAEMLAVIRLAAAPEILIGPQCDDPFTCPLHEVCWEFLPENSPLNLTGFRKVDAFELIHGGLLKLEEISDEIDLTGKQSIQIDAARTGNHHIDPKKIRDFLKGLSSPRYYLDFETFQSAVPEFDDTRPYQQIPFQFSLHVVAAPGAVPEHHSYLSEGKVDPRPEFLALLRDRLGDLGPIICYNAAFERGIVDAAVEVLPDFKGWWKSAQKRFVDLLIPFRAFAYYHPDQLGSASLKAVLPALTRGPGYEGLEICDGGMASWEYRRVTFGKNVEPAERAQIRKQLEEYCGLDTEAMIRIVAALEALELPAVKSALTKAKKKKA
ncbi:MAG: DUF2779 domain-containing protein [Candidatus Aminicenantales bacterium]